MSLSTNLEKIGKSFEDSQTSANHSEGYHLQMENIWCIEALNIPRSCQAPKISPKTKPEITEELKKNKKPFYSLSREQRYFVIFPPECCIVW